MAQGQRRDADARRVLCAPALFCVSPADLVRRNRPPVRNDGAAGCARHADDGRRRRAALAGTTTEPCGIDRISSRRHVLQRRELRAACRVVRIRRGSALVRHGVLPDGFGFDEHRRRVPGGRRAPQPAHGSDKRAENAGDLRHGRRCGRAGDRHHGADGPPQASHDAERRRASADDSGPWDAARARVYTEAARARGGRRVRVVTRGPARRARPDIDVRRNRRGASGDCRAVIHAGGRGDDNTRRRVRCVARLRDERRVSFDRSSARSR